MNHAAKIHIFPKMIVEKTIIVIPTLVFLSHFTPLMPFSLTFCTPFMHNFYF